MTNKKISTLPVASTPLAGTELIPIVQGGITDQVSVANLTAGRPVNVSSLTATGFISTADGAEVGFGSGTSGIVGNSASSYLDLYAGGNNWLSLNSTGIRATGNVTMSTAAKGINFTANTPAAGMTSQLLNWYEEGTWTPIDGSGAGLSFTSVSGKYTRYGRIVTINAVLNYPATSDVSAAKINGLPYATGIEAVVSVNQYNGTVISGRLLSATISFVNAASFITPVTNAGLSTVYVIVSSTYQI